MSDAKAKDGRVVDTLLRSLALIVEQSGDSVALTVRVGEQTIVGKLVTRAAYAAARASSRTASRDEDVGQQPCLYFVDAERSVHGHSHHVGPVRVRLVDVEWWHPTHPPSHPPSGA